MQQTQGTHGSAVAARPILYVASSVTNATQEYRERIKTFKLRLAEATRAHVVEWIEKNSAVELSDFFRRDLNNVRMCDAMIAIVDEPSIGVGMEIREALSNEKPIICLYQEGVSVSRLLLSARDLLNFSVRGYRTLDEAVAIASEFVLQHRLISS